MFTIQKFVQSPGDTKYGCTCEPKKYWEGAHAMYLGGKEAEDYKVVRKSY